MSRMKRWSLGLAVVGWLVLALIGFTGEVRAHNTPATWDQASFWFRDDDGGEACDSVPDCTTGATGYGSPNAAAGSGVTEVVPGTDVRLRINLLKNNNGDQALPTTPVLEFKVDGACGDSSGWTTVPTQSTCSSTAICQATSDNFADGDTTSELLDALADRGGDMVEAGGAANLATYTTGNGTDAAEWEWMLDTTNAAESTTYTLRVSKDTTGTNYSTYTTCPTLGTGAAAVTTYTQNDFEWFVTADSLTLTDVWPSGGVDIGENAAIGLPVANQLLVSGDKIRIQINFLVSTLNLAINSKNFALQYVEAEDCSTATDWADVGAKPSGTIWRLFDEASIVDSIAQENQISTSTGGAEGYYSEINPSGNNPNAVDTGQYSEWDWPVENNGASTGTTYCFRMTEGDGGRTVFNAYTNYPKLTTTPDIGNLLRHGNFFSKFKEQGFFWGD